jgi:competence protein ComEA
MNGSLQSLESAAKSEVRHMTRGLNSPRGPWWKNLKATPAMGIAAAVLVAGYFGAKFFREGDGTGTVATRAIAEGTIRVNLNTATLTELESIPGIGTVLAKQIVAGRPYASVDDLLKIRGIGESSLKALRTYVKVDGETEKLR